MRKTLLSTLAVAVLLGPSTTCLAQGSLKPMVVVSFSGYDKLLADIELIGKLADNPDMAKGLEMMLKMMTQGKGLDGLDTKRPWGAVVESDGQSFPVYGFVPVSDLKKLLEVLKGMNIEIKEAEGGVHEVNLQGRPPLYIKQQSDWAFIGASPEALAKMPDDPTKALAGLSDKYDLAVRASIQSVPPPIRQMITAQIQMGAAAGMDRMPNETDEQYAVRTKLARQGIEQAIAAINDLDMVLLGFTIDNKDEKAFLDIEITAVEGSKTAADMAAASEQAKTDVAGFFMPEAAATGNWAGKMSKADITQAKSSIASVRQKAIAELANQGLSQEETDLAKQLLGDILDVVEKTVESGKVDGAAALLLDPDAMTLLVGGHLVEGAKLEKVLKQLAELATKDNAEIAKLVKLDAEKHQGVNLHTLSIPIPEETENRDKIVRLVGETLDVVMGISEDGLYMAAGRDAMSKLKEAVDKSKAEAGKEIPPMHISVAATPIAKAIAELGEDEAKPVAAMVVAALEKSAGKDHVTITSTGIERGMKIHLELEQGILKLIGSAAQMTTGMTPVATPPTGATPPATTPPATTPPSTTPPSTTPPK